MCWRDVTPAPSLTIVLPLEGQPHVYLEGADSDDDWARFDDWIRSKPELHEVVGLVAKLSWAKAA